MRRVSWGPQRWERLEFRIGRKIARATTEQAAWSDIVRAARAVLRAYSSSFFLVTRFLPPIERAEVEVVYAAVRYPDEIVDTFPLSGEEKLARLNRWEQHYREALRRATMRERAASGVPWILCGFAHLVRQRGIPEKHYLAFLDAMRHDARPREFQDFDDLIRNYVHGSAIVVGYFLTYIYGTAPRHSLEEALEVSRELGIALQLTNFARDVEEDRRRGRLYVPREVCELQGARVEDLLAGSQPWALRRAARWLAEEAEPRYDFARERLHVFAADCQAAILACIDVYQKLNRRLLTGEHAGRRRVRLNALEKFRLLPAEKYWRVPLAYARLL